METKTQFTVIDGGRDEIERELVKLVFTPGSAPKEAFGMLMKLLEPSTSRVSLVPDVTKSPRPEDAVRD